MNKPVKVPGRGVYEGNFTVDSTVGTNTVIIVVFTPGTSPDLDLLAYSPTSILYNQHNASSYSVDEPLGTAQLALPDPAEVRDSLKKAPPGLDCWK